MATNEEWERRLSAVERELADVRRLAAGAHEDAGDAKSTLRNHGRLINGWGEQI
ncbi:hypothetical protein GCM10012275_42480 [Longimycelium tulufanense]|uniref:Uncharacterized protein n=1 Tax=Longimycelium tulufanense TaxID=907463 RepID=A0A8J3CHI3_9PSEU|nr:hypothetical protein [Longimycelium tulufanense]GGM67392.1 hypothetical protein GCM10012275_42480 [Longimycelium tulufanense]